MNQKIEDIASRNFSIGMISSLVRAIPNKEWYAGELLPTKYLINNPRYGEMDVVVRLNDGSILNIEFQSTEPTKKDLIRFLEYKTVLIREYECPVHTLIVCSANIKKQEYNLNVSLNMNFKPLILNFKDIDGKQTLNDITSKIENNQIITDEDKTKLAFITLLSFKKDEYYPNIKKAAIILEDIKLNEKDKETIATTQFLLAGKFLNKIQLKEIRLVLKMALNAFEIIENEMKNEWIAEGMAKGKVEGEEKSKTKIAKKLLEDKFDIEYISKITGLTVKQVKNL